MASKAPHLNLEHAVTPERREDEVLLAAVTTLPATAEHGVTSDRESAAEMGRRPDAASQSVIVPSEAGRRVARNLGALVGGQAITWTVTLLWTLIVPRALGPVGLGILVSAQSVSGVFGIALGIGARDYLVRETVVDQTAGPSLVGTALVLRIALIPIVGLAAVAWAQLAHYGHEARIVLYLISAMTVFTLLMEPLQAAFQAMERMKYIAYANVINKTAQSIVGIALVSVGFKVVGIAADMAVISAAVVVLSAWWLRSLFRIDLKTSPTLMVRVARESFAYWGYVLSGMIYLWIDTIMLTLMTRPRVVGWYGASTALFQTLIFLPAFVQTAWLPRLVAAFGKSRRDLQKAAQAPVELVLMLSVPIAAGTAIGAHALIHTVYGPGFSHAVPVMTILALCIPPIYLNIVLASVLIAAKRQATWTIVMMGAAVVNPLMNLGLIPLTQARYHNGAIGAAISLVLTEVLIDSVGLVLVGRHVFEWRIVKRCALMCLAAAGMVAAAQATRPLGTLASLAIGFTTMGIAVALLRIVSRDELAMVRAGIAAVKPGHKRLSVPKN